jgi:predicted NBD/HSP70 family sugar kinase
VIRHWLRDAAPAIAHAVQSTACVLDVNNIIVDGAISRELLDAVLRAVDRALDRHSWEGVARPTLQRGAIGSDARALGAALLPIYANYAPDRGAPPQLAP